MKIEDLRRFYSKHPGRQALLKELSRGRNVLTHVTGLQASAAPLMFSTLLDGTESHSMLFILNDQDEAAYFYNDMLQTVGQDRVLYFPSAFRRAAKYGQKDDANQVLRTEVLSRMLQLKSQPDAPAIAVVTSPDALAEKVVSEDAMKGSRLELSVNQEVDREDLQKKLFDFGFERVDYVYEPGQYALRGSILDVFSFSSEYPYRIDFFGDEIDSIRQFQVDTQLSTEKRDSIAVVPSLDSQEKCSETLLDFMPSEMVLVANSLRWTAERMDAIYREVNETDSITARMRVLSDGGSTSKDELPDYVRPLVTDGNEFREKILSHQRVELGANPSEQPASTVRFDCQSQPSFHKKFELVSSTLTEFIAHGYKLFILTDSEKQAERLKTIFEERGDQIPFTYVDHTIHGGFTDNTLRCCFFTDHQIFDRYHKYQLKSDSARRGKMALTLKEINEFEIGDFLVHMDHGIGRFGGLVRIPNGNTMTEAIKLIYRNEDVVYVSIHSLHKVSKYKGKEGDAPSVNKLGSGAWENMKERTKGKIKDIARDLIRLYSKRSQEKGFAYSPDTYLQNELEASFIYEDTPDQLKATIDIKADMESSRPMDRLVCGDVGFGKTEVAIRAAFKAVCDSKQVAVLVPTTILAFQHYQTFRDRLKEFPCKVEYLSRAKTAKEVTAILKDLAEGKIDIIVGTHKLIGKNVKFKDLGLLIIDEEQKFGVAVKEKLKALKVNVDTLTLTATPIPRTLQFSLMGARDMSVIQTPPPNRYPIQTEVHVFSPDIIREAVNFEMSRNGQLFLISNRISSLPDLESLVRREVPDARVCVGHGQMNPDELEKILLDFVNYEYDVLIATSIVENGIDIPNVNTIIVNQAHNFGLSDLHQMRGRVGRGNRKAFCYLLAPPLGALPQESRRRLQAIENFSDLGGGIQLALQDLDIRGAGNLLGAEQSGFISDLGYETYQKILKEAVRELKNDEFSDLFASQQEQNRKEGQVQSAEMYVDDCTVESDLELLFPQTYVPSGSERILLYRELDNLERESDIVAFRKRMEDRFGRIPEQAQELIRLVTLRRKARRLGIERIFLKGGRMSLFFTSHPDSPYFESDAFGCILAYAAQNPMECRLRDVNGGRSILIQNVKSVETAISTLESISAEPVTVRQ